MSLQGRRRLVAALVVTALLTAGCGSADGGQQDGTPQPGGTPQRGGTLTVINSVDARSFDPARAATNAPGSEVARLAAVYGALFWRDLETGEVHPGIGQSLEPSDDGRVWTLKLRPSVKFTDGTPLDAEAVVVNWERLGDPEVRASMYAEAKDLELRAVDGLTVEITLPEPNFHFDKRVAADFTFIVSPTAIRSDPEGFGEKPVGAGPFKLVEWVPGSHTRYVRNDDYWEGGKPYLDELVIRSIPDASQAVETVISGGADLYYSNLWEMRQRAEEAGLNVVAPETGAGRIIYFNHDRPPFDDPRAREAVIRAVDSSQLAKVMDPGAGSDAPTSMFTEDSPFHDDGLTLPRHDRARAQELFDELAAEGKPVTFEFAGIAGATYERAVEYIQSQLEQFGNVEMTINTVDFAAANETIYVKRDFDATIRPGILPLTDPEPSLTDLLQTGGRNNVSAYSNPEMDAALDAGRATTDTARRAEAYAEAQRLLAEDSPLWVYGNASPFLVYADRVTGIQLWEEGVVLYDQIGLVEQ